MTEYNYIAYYKDPATYGLHDCQTKGKAINLLSEKQKTKGITPIAIIERTTNEMVWYNPELGKENCQN